MYVKAIDTGPFPVSAFLLLIDLDSPLELTSGIGIVSIESTDWKTIKITVNINFYEHLDTPDTKD